MAIVAAFSTPYPLITAQTIIKRALRLIGVYAVGESLSAEDAQDGLASLNSLVGSLSNSRLLINAMTLDTLALTAGRAEYTVGTSGDIETTRPVRIDPSSYVTKAGISYPLKFVDATDYNSLPEKAAQGDAPEYVWVNGSYPDTTLTFYPVPGSGFTLNLWSWKEFERFSSITDPVSLPQGYEEMLAFNLAQSIAPEYETEASAEVKRQAMLTMKRIKRTNTAVPCVALPNAVLPRYFPSHIESDT